MKRSTIFVLATALAFAGTAVVHAEEATEQARKVEQDPTVCKRVKQLGTHFKRKVCMKKSEWAVAKEDSQAAMRTMTSGPPGPKSGS